MKLIDADALCKHLHELKTGDKDTVYEYYDDGIDTAISTVAVFPTIEAEPVKHGEWRDYPIADGCLQCSICGVLRIGGPSNFCPHCGARMDAEEGEA